MFGKKNNEYIDFKKKFTFEKRLDESSRIIEKYPERIPVIVERAKTHAKDIDDIDRNKFLVPNDLTMANFMYIIRKRLKLSPEKSIFLFVNNTSIVPTSTLMSNIYTENKDEDGFLYIRYASESTFG